MFCVGVRPLLPRAVGLGALVLLVLAAGCSTVPKEQTLAFSTMVTSVGTTVDPLMDRLSVAQRQHQQQATAAHPASTFSVEDASYYATIGDAREAGEFRAGFGVIVGYTKVVVSLVDGSSAAKWQAEASSILKDVSSLTNSPMLSSLSGPLNLIFGQIATAASNAQARKLVLQGKPQMIALIDALIEAGGPIFDTLTQDDLSAASGRSWTERRADIEAARAEVSNYIVLLQNLKGSFGQLSEAYLRQTDPEGLGEIAAAAGALAADAKAARTAFAAFHH